jgi:hypothetical protein
MRSTSSATARRAQAGFTMLMAVFLVAAMLIVAAAAAPNLLTEGRREKEEEMVWRGQQYARAIGLYYKKFGKYPTKVEDLTQQTNGVRFLRQAYKDPMNKEDGSWRFIYVGPNGQLIGSLRQTNLLQSALSMPGASALSAFGGMQMPSIPGAGTNPQAGAPGTPGTGAPGFGIGAPGQASTNPAARWSDRRRKYRWRRQQDQEALASDLHGRGYLPDVGIHLESRCADWDSRPGGHKSERDCSRRGCHWSDR